MSSSTLHYCACFGFVELAEPLIERGAEIEAQDEEGKTPLRVAHECDQNGVAELLLKRGAAT